MNKRKKRKKRINSKKKGNRVELEFAKILSDRFNKTFKRVPLSGAWGTANRYENIREDAKDVLSGDIICPPNFRFSVECKGRYDFNFWDLLNEETKHLEIDDWIWQAEQDALISNKEPLIMIKVNNRKPFVLFKRKLKEGTLTYKGYAILRFDYFLQLDEDFFWDK